MVKNSGDEQGHTDKNQNIHEAFFEKLPNPAQILDRQGRVIEVNHAWVEELGYDRNAVEGKKFQNFVSDERSSVFREWFDSLRQGEAVDEIELELNRKGNGTITASIQGKAYRDNSGDLTKALCTLEEISGIEPANSRYEIILKLLNQLCKPTGLRGLMKDVTRLMRNWSGCEAVGIRLKQGEDFPYFETRGFDQEFVLSENSLCEVDSEGEIVRDSSGNPVLDCMCGNVIRGNTDPDKPFFSEKGSFWTNSTTDLLASASEEDKQSRTRDRCNGEGYESVALVPVRHGGETLGLLQFDDSRRGVFDRDLLELLERLADNLALAIRQRRDAQNLRESEEKFRQVFEEGALGITLVDFDLNYIDVNSRFCEMLGYSKEELSDKTFVDITHPEDRGKDKETIKQLKNGEIPYYRTEKRYIGKGGEVIWAYTTVTTVQGSSEGSRYLLAMAHDITERKEREEELRETRAFLDSVLDGLSVHMAIIDNHGEIVKVNEAWRKFAEENGLEADQVSEGTNYIQVSENATGESSGGAEEFVRGIRKVKSGKKDIYSQEYSCHSPDQKRWFIAQVTPFPGKKRNHLVITHENITERKRAERKLKENKNLLARAEELANLGSWEWNIEEGRFKLSEEWQKIHGWDRNELSRSEMISTIHPDDRKRVKKTVKEAWKNAEPYEIDHRMIRHDSGDVRNVKVYGEFIQEDGRPVKMYGSSLDITERKQQKEQLLKTHRRLKEIVDHSPDPIYIKDKKGRYLLLNEAAAEVLDVDVQSAIGKDDYDLFNSKDAELIRKDDSKVMDVGEPIIKERTYTVNGEEYVFIVNKYPYRDENGDIIGVVGISHDITERKRIERELENSERRFREVWNSTSEGFWVANKEGKLLEANSAYADMVGYSQKELRGKKIASLEAKETPEETRRHIERIIESGEDRFETRHRTKTGDEVEVEITIDYLENWEQFFCFIRDITERKRREEKLNKRRDELRNLSKRLIKAQEEERKRISRELHDELGQSLTGLSMNLSEMEEVITKNGETGIESSIVESLKLVEDLSEGLDEIVAELRPTMLDDLGLVPTLRWYLKRLKNRTDLSINYQFEKLSADLAEEVETVLYRVTQEAMNNVVKHSNAEAVQVKMEELESGLELSIEDDGRGFDTSELSTPRQKDGGVGLTGIRERLYAVDGELEVSSEKGKGTRLKVTIPLGE